MTPSVLPWDMMRTLITETYGGKIDEESDFRHLSELVNNFFTPAAFESEHHLVAEISDVGQDGEGDDSLIVPEGTVMKDFMEWVDRLPEREPPTFLGLPANAEKLLLVGHGKDLIANWAQITDLLDEGEQLMAEAAEVD